MKKFVDKFNEKFNTDYYNVYINSAFVFVKEYNDEVELYGIIIEDKNLKTYFYIWGIYSCSEPPNYDAEDYVSNNLENIKNKLAYDYIIDVFEIDDNKEFSKFEEMMKFALDECNYHNMLESCEL